MIFYAHQGFSADIVQLAVDNMHPEGLVIATMGSGSLPDAANSRLGDISAKHTMPIVYCKRSTDGMVPLGSMPKINNTFLVAGGYLNPQKARILLQLCLHDGMDIRRIRETFAGVYGG
ncbi:Asparaginase/glutaminase [Metschnikowia bicuspidata]|uniref:asparaginase n=1 Tax=Metschnikowia bicuspidata TaxID=27322 RepID=A0A4P9Z8N4_9ASCO|nr:Asparaginase/glutaminase [Metschnikowia bicuspidata]